MYRDFLIIFSIIFIHELGHLFVALLYKWNLDKLVIYPFGGCVKFNEDVNRPLYQELFILISGPLMQIIYFFIIYILYRNDFITFRNFLLFKNYHYVLLIFNLLPIYPLDGGKIINVLFGYLLPYKKGNKLVIFLSLVLLFLILVFYKNFNFYSMSILIIYELIIYYKRQEYLYNKFLLERYLNNYNFEKRKIINNKNNMYRDKKHVIYVNNRYFTEREYLEKRYGG